MAITDGNTNKIVAAIVFAAIVISGSLVFLGVRVNGGNLSDDVFQEKVSKSIDAYIANEQKKAQDAQVAADKPKFVTGDFTDDDPVLGNKNAKVSIVEFSDYQCPYCGKFEQESFPQIKSQYIDTGKVKFVYRDFPLSFHQYAYPSALFGECVHHLSGSPDADYYKVHDKLFETVQNGKFDYDVMSKFAVGIGVDGAALKKCFDGDKYKDEIAADQKAGEDAGISGTPGFIINGQVISGAQPFSKFQPIIEDALKAGAVTK
ncbi:DsbA family protein [Candidatus Peregrinibacteria bacterium]|nr:DsbA family protein [Candidatus Peregrinibacteria bacterium]